MVYCTKCGTKNPDDAKTCSQCGAPLYSLGEREQRRRKEGNASEPAEAKNLTDGWRMNVLESPEAAQLSL